MQKRTRLEASKIPNLEGAPEIQARERLETRRAREGQNDFLESFCYNSRMTRAERITIDPNICHGKPCVRGLRYPVEHVLEWLSSGMTHEEILADYADLEREDIFAVLEFATQLSRVKRLEFAGA
jgi:uncharacterized protein (DUF433 family)